MSTTALTRVYISLAYVVSSLLTALIAVLTYHNAAAIEGSLFPVVRDVRITRVEARDDYHSWVWGDFSKARDCKLTGMEWSRDGLFVPFRFVEGVDAAEDGQTFEFGPVELALPADMVDGSQSVVTHRCHPFWETRSAFLDPEG